MPTLGELPAALDAADVDISAITDVVFTHAHPDHIWGILDDFDDLLMPDAAYHISQAEWDFWDSDDAVSAMVPGRESFAVGAKSRFDKLRDQISFFKGGDDTHQSKIATLLRKAAQGKNDPWSVSNVPYLETQASMHPQLFSLK